VVGLVAARLRERFERPAFAIALLPDGSATGSGRSLPGVDLGRAVIAALEAGLIRRGGGHAMAAGVSLSHGQLGQFRAFLAEALGAAVERARQLAVLSVDAALTARAATPEFFRELERAGPYGAGNPNPVLVFPGHFIRFAEIVGTGAHVRFYLTSGDGGRLRATAFRAATTPVGQALLACAEDRPVHVAGTLSLDHYQGRETVQLRVLDLSAA
jgi:single-stranded-DNA-specific exonuclease